ncbi:MAG: Rpp14/Pop5 family protein [Halobacteria archaeon]
MKRSQPSLRTRRRYMVAEVKSPSPLSEELLGGALRREIRDLFGDSGAAAVDAGVEAWVPLPGSGASRVLLRVVRERVDEARAALAALREVEGRPVAVRVIGVSGTLRGARRWSRRPPKGLKGAP